MIYITPSQRNNNPRFSFPRLESSTKSKGWKLQSFRGFFILPFISTETINHHLSTGHMRTDNCSLSRWLARSSLSSSWKTWPEMGKRWRKPVLHRSGHHEHNMYVHVDPEDLGSMIADRRAINVRQVTPHTETGRTNDPWFDEMCTWRKLITFLITLKNELASRFSFDSKDYVWLTLTLTTIFTAAMISTVPTATGATEIFKLIKNQKIEALDIVFQLFNETT